MLQRTKMMSQSIHCIVDIVCKSRPVYSSSEQFRAVQSTCKSRQVQAGAVSQRENSHVPRSMQIQTCSDKCGVTKLKTVSAGKMSVSQKILKFREEVSFLNATRLDTFATQLKREDHPTIYPQLTCDWFIQGLDFCCSTWRHNFKQAIGTNYHSKSRTR